MADTRKAFLQRVISAVLAGFTLLGMGVYGGAMGLQVACALVVAICTREFAHIAFRNWPVPRAVEYSYYLVGAGIFAGIFFAPILAIEILALGMVTFLVTTLWITRAKASNENLLGALGMGTFGLIYVVFFPTYAALMTLLHDGPQWFLFLLLVVFAGDTMAYFGGRALGKHKMLPSISPNKTWEGAVSGLIGSCIAGSIQLHRAFPDVSPIAGVIFCALCAIAAQSGDLLMSLVKRVGHVKDSGHIMPGHGGALDRMDGILISCPLVYAFALYVSPAGMLIR
jgi:phosphatidate cytidylyltransferase